MILFFECSLFTDIQYNSSNVALGIGTIFPSLIPHPLLASGWLKQEQSDTFHH